MFDIKGFYNASPVEQDPKLCKSIHIYFEMGY